MSEATAGGTAPAREYAIRGATAAAALVPGILTVGLAFRSGGFYPGATAAARSC